MQALILSYFYALKTTQVVSSPQMQASQNASCVDFVDRDSRRQNDTKDLNSDFQAISHFVFGRNPKTRCLNTRLVAPITISVLEYIAEFNTLVLLIELRAPLKKPSSETTFFELLVLAFRVFEFQRSKVENSEEV